MDDRDFEMFMRNKKNAMGVGGTYLKPEEDQNSPATDKGSSSILEIPQAQPAKSSPGLETMNITPAPAANTEGKAANIAANTVAGGAVGGPWGAGIAAVGSTLNTMLSAQYQAEQAKRQRILDMLSAEAQMKIKASDTEMQGTNQASMQEQSGLYRALMGG